MSPHLSLLFRLTERLMGRARIAFSFKSRTSGSVIGLSAMKKSLKGTKESLFSRDGQLRDTRILGHNAGPVCTQISRLPLVLMPNYIIRNVFYSRCICLWLWCVYSHNFLPCFLPECMSAYSLRPPEYASRSQKAFMKIAKGRSACFVLMMIKLSAMIYVGFAALPKVPMNAEGLPTSSTSRVPRLSKSTEDLLRLAELPPPPDEMSDEMERKILASR